MANANAHADVPLLLKRLIVSITRNEKQKSDEKSALERAYFSLLIPNDIENEKWTQLMYTKCFGILLDLEDTHEPPPSFDENGFDSRESENEFKLATLIGQGLSIVQEPWDKFQTCTHAPFGDHLSFPFTMHASFLSLLTQISNPKPIVQESFFPLREYDELVVEHVRGVVEDKNKFFNLELNDKEKNESDRPIDDSTEESTALDWTQIQKRERRKEIPPSMYFTEHPAEPLYANRRFFDRHYQFFSERQDARVLTEFDLVQDSLLVLQGVPSNSYILDKNVFQPADVRLKTTSIASTVNMMRIFANAGSSYARLERVGEEFVRDPHQHGLIRQALGRTLHLFLGHYTALLPKSQTMIQLVLQSKSGIAKLNEIAALCTDIAVGADLIQYFYEREGGWIFGRLCHVYFKWIQDWIYQGELPGTEEFFITGDKPPFTYDISLLPAFLHSVADEIYSTGLVVYYVREAGGKIEGHVPLRIIKDLHGVTRQRAKYIELSLHYGRENARIVRARIQQSNMLLLAKRREIEVNKLEIQTALKRQQRQLMDLAEERRKQRQELLDQQLEYARQMKERPREQVIEMGSILPEPSAIDRARQNIIDEYEHAMNDAKRRIDISNWQFRRHLHDNERIEWLAMDEDRKELRMTAKRNVRQRRRERNQMPDVEPLDHQIVEQLEQFEEVHSQNDDESIPEETIHDMESLVISPVQSPIQNENTEETEIANIEDDVDDIDIEMEENSPIMETSSIMEDVQQDQSMNEQNDTQDNLIIDVPETTFDFAEIDEEEYLSDEEIIDENPFLDYEEELGLIVPLEISLEHSLIAPALSQFRSINKTFMTLMFQEKYLMEHFEAARRYLLMQNSDWAHAFISCLSVHNGMTDHLVRLNDVLERSLQDSDCWETDPLCKNLIFERNDGTTKPVIWDSIETLVPFKLKYRSTFPINLVFDEAALIDYETIFQFMVKLKRTVWNVREVWILFKHSEAKKRNMRELQLFAREMQHVIEAISNYVTTHVIATAAREFECKIKMEEGESTDDEDLNLNSLNKYHQEYLERILRGCLLYEQTKPLYDLLMKIFKSVLTFYVQLRNSPPSLAIHAIPYQAMLRTRDEFRYDVLLLCKTLDKMLFSLGTRREEDDRRLFSSSHQLAKLLLLLDFNRFYREQDK